MDEQVNGWDALEQLARTLFDTYADGGVSWDSLRPALRASWVRVAGKAIEAAAPHGPSELTVQERLALVRAGIDPNDTLVLNWSVGNMGALMGLKPDGTPILMAQLMVVIDPDILQGTKISRLDPEGTAKAAAQRLGGAVLLPTTWRMVVKKASLEPSVLAQVADLTSPAPDLGEN